MTEKTIPAPAAQPKTASNQAVTAQSALKAGAAAALGLLLANCAGQQSQMGYSSQQSREFGAFSSPKYGSASPRMYADTGAAMPKGGGRDHIGKAYSIAGKRYVPHDRSVGSAQTGMASWYGAAFHGRKTANGEIYDRRSFTAAHPTMPLPSYARVTNMRNGYSVIVRVNDRGPYHGGRIMDVSERVADSLQFKAMGTGRIRVDYLGRAGLGGSDDVRLAQSLTMDGRPAVASYIPASYGENRAQVQVAAVSTPAPRTVAVASAIPSQSSGFVATNSRSLTTSAPAVIAAPVAAPSVQQAKAAAAGASPVSQTSARVTAPSAAPVPPARPSTAAKPRPVDDDVEETGTVKAPARSPGMAAAIAAAKAGSSKATANGKSDADARKTAPSAKAQPQKGTSQGAQSQKATGKTARIALAD